MEIQRIPPLRDFSSDDSSIMENSFGDTPTEDRQIDDDTATKDGHFDDTSTDHRAVGNTSTRDGPVGDTLTKFRQISENSKEDKQINDTSTKDKQIDESSSNGRHNIDNGDGLEGEHYGGGDGAPGLKNRKNMPKKLKKRVSWSDQQQQQQSTEESLEKHLKKRIFHIMLVLYTLAFLSSFSYWIQSGVLPFLTRKVGMTPMLFGLMESSYAFYQMITSPVYGRLGDLFGVRIIYMLSELSASVTFGSLALANSIPALFLTRIPALLMHSVQCSYMIITDISTPSSRADLLGKVGVLHGMGMIFGSLTGGLVTHAFDEKTAAVVAAISNLLSVGIIFIFIPNDTKHIRFQMKDLKEESADAHNNIKLPTTTTTTTTTNAQNESETVTPTLSAIGAVLKVKNMKFLLLIKILIAFPYSLLYSMFSMATMDYYHLDAKSNGMVLAYLGVLTILVQGLLVGFLSKYFSDATNVKTMLFLNMVGFLFLVVADRIIVLVVVVIPLAIGGTVSHIILMTVITKIVPVEDTGSALGFVFALHAIVRAVAPGTGGVMFTNLGWPYFGLVGYIFHVFLLGYVLVCGRDEQYEGV